MEKSVLGIQSVCRFHLTFVQSIFRSNKYCGAYSETRARGGRNASSNE